MISHLTYNFVKIDLDDFEVDSMAIDLIRESIFFNDLGGGMVSSPLIYSPLFHGLYNDEEEEPEPFEREIWATRFVAHKGAWKLFLKEDEIWALSPKGKECIVSESPLELVHCFLRNGGFPVHAPPWTKENDDWPDLETIVCP
jgi:hypothetical protein